MSTVEDNPTALAVVEPASSLITIEPAKYVALVFEPFQKRLDAAKLAAKSVTYDISTTSGMRAAIELRAMFRDIRIGSEKARKERKAPILEIGKLLDSRHKEIEAEIEPLERAPDDAIKAEEKRKDDEKIAKALAESQRITKIRLTIDTIRHVPTDFIGKPSAEIGVAADHLSEQVLSLDFYAEYTGEAMAERDNAVKQLRTMQEAMRQHEAEQQRLADERAELARKQAALAEQERLAAAARAKQEENDRLLRAEEERIARERREAAEAEQRAAQQQAAEAMRVQQEQHQARMQAQQAELDAKQAVIDAAIAEQERVAREAREAAEAEERRRQEEADAAARAEADRIRAAKDAAAAAELAEAARQLAERQAAEAETERRERVNFIKNGPAPEQIILALADEYRVDAAVARDWLALRDWKLVEVS